MVDRVNYIPDDWVVLKLPNNQGYKIFGQWVGGYLNGDNWRLNSGITKVEEHDDFYLFYGVSNSVYECHKKNYGIGTTWLRGIVDNFVRAGSTIMSQDTNWSELDYEIRY